MQASSSVPSRAPNSRSVSASAAVVVCVSVMATPFRTGCGARMLAGLRLPAVSARVQRATSVCRDAEHPGARRLRGARRRRAARAAPGRPRAIAAGLARGAPGAALARRPRRPPAARRPGRERPQEPAPGGLVAAGGPRGAACGVAGERARPGRPRLGSRARPGRPWRVPPAAGRGRPGGGAGAGQGGTCCPASTTSGCTRRGTSTAPRWWPSSASWWRGPTPPGMRRPRSGGPVAARAPTR
jgi:hypothetical protein